MKVGQELFILLRDDVRYRELPQRFKGIFRSYVLTAYGTAPAEHYIVGILQVYRRDMSCRRTTVIEVQFFGGHDSLTNLREEPFPSDRFS